MNYEKNSSKEVKGKKNMVEKIKQLLMEKGFGVEGAIIVAEHLVANGVMVWNGSELCKDNVLCCDDNCQRCAQRIYKAYCNEHKKNKLT